MIVLTRNLVAGASAWSFWKPSAEVSGRDGGPVTCCAGCEWCSGKAGRCAPVGRSEEVGVVARGGAHDVCCGKGMEAWVVLLASCSTVVVAGLV